MPNTDRPWLYRWGRSEFNGEHHMDEFNAALLLAAFLSNLAWLPTVKDMFYGK